MCYVHTLTHLNVALHSFSRLDQSHRTLFGVSIESIRSNQCLGAFIWFVLEFRILVVFYCFFSPLLSVFLSLIHSLIVFLASHRSINEEVKTYLSSKEGSKSIPTATLFPVSSSHLKICLMRTSDENRWLLSNVHWFGVAFQQLTINSLRMWNLLLNFHLKYLKSALFKWNPNTLRSN